MTAPTLIVEATIRFLRGHEPFVRMARAALETLAARAELTYHPAGSAIAGPDSTDGAFYILQQGHAAARSGGDGE